MISKHFNYSQLSAAVLSALLVTACGSDVSKPSNDREGMADSLGYESTNQVDLDYTLANQLDPELGEYNGEATVVTFTPPNSIVSGLEEFKTHTFKLTADDTILAPDPTKCPSDLDYMQEVPFKHQIVFADVNPTAPGSGHAGGQNTVTSVINGDKFEVKFAVPEGHYGLTYEANLVFAEQSYDFTVTTPQPSDLLRDNELMFDFSAVQNTQGDAKVVADGQTISFKFLKQDLNDTPDDKDDDQMVPVAGLSNYVKSEFTFVSDQDTYIGEDEEGEAVILPVATLGVYSADTYKAEEQQPYASCAQNGDYLKVDFNLPDYVYDQTYRAQLTWQYEEVEYEMVQGLDADGLPDWDDYGNAVMVPKRDDRGVPIVISRQTKTQIIPFEVVTESKDVEFDTIDKDYFAVDGRNSGAELGEELVYTVDLKGYNAILPLSVSALADGEPVTGQVLYSIDGRFFTDAPGAVIEPGQTLQIKVIARDEYLKDIVPSLTIGEGDDAVTWNWRVRTEPHPDDAILDASLDYPAPVAATASDTVTLRGSASINTNDLALTASNLKVALVNPKDIDPVTEIPKVISSEPVDSLEDGVWTYTASLPDAGEYHFMLISDVGDAPVSAFDVLNLNPLLVHVTKLTSADDQFPTNETGTGAAWDTRFKDLVDVTIDGRGGFPIFYMAEKTGKQVTEYRMGPSLDKVSKPTTLYGSRLEKNIGGVAVNNFRPVTDGNYLIRAKWQGAHLRVSDLSNAPNLQKMATPDAYLEGLSDTIWDGRQMVVAENGNTLYVTGNDGLARISMNYSLEGSPIQDKEATTRRKWISKKTFGTTTNYGGTVSVDLLYVGEGEARTEYILTLAQNKDDRVARVYATVKKDIYDETVPLTQLKLVDDSGAPVSLAGSTSIAVDSERMTAYVAHTGGVAQIDLSNLTSILTETASGAATTGSTVTDLTLLSSENTIGELSSIVSEGGLPYLVATDMTNSALYAIDPETGEVVYLVQGNEPTSDN